MGIWQRLGTVLILEEFFKEEKMEGKATLEFKLPEQEFDFTMASNGEKFALFISEMRQEFRNKWKYPSTLDGVEKVSWGEVDDFFRESLKESGIYDLIENIP